MTDPEGSVVGRFRRECVSHSVHKPFEFLDRSGSSNPDIGDNYNSIKIFGFACHLLIII